MEIRFATEQDVAGILELLRQVGDVHHQIRPDIFRKNAQKYGASQVLAMLNSSRTPIFVAVEEGKVLGYGFCQVKSYKDSPVVNDHTEVFIDDLCVDENHRGQGIGTALYNTVCRYARQRRAHSVTLNVWQANASALKFYESLGLKPRNIGMENRFDAD